MIKIVFERGQDQKIYGIEVSGHAGYADSGKDIVCAAVSSQVISVENSMYKLLGIEMPTVINEQEGGYLKLSLPEIEDQDVFNQAQFLLKHLHLTYEIMSQTYPDFIQVTDITNKP